MVEKINDDEDESASVFTELASEIRRTVLIKLNERSLKLSQLAKELNVTVQHAHTNINRLINNGLVEKKSNGSLEITSYGKTIVIQISTFHFLARHKDYFQEHTLGDLPLKFARRVGDLNNCSVVKGVTAVLQRWKLMCQAAGEYVNTIASQVQVDLIEPLAVKVRSGTKLSYIMPEDVIVPKGTLETTRKVSWKSLLAEGKTQRRMVRRILLATIVTDKSAGVLFPNLKNEVDMNVMLYSEDPAFREWCEDYFRYVWSSADLFDERSVQREI